MSTVTAAIEAMAKIDPDQLDERIETLREELATLERLRSCIVGAPLRTSETAGEPLGVFSSSVIRAKQLEQENAAIREVLTPEENGKVCARLGGSVGRRKGDLSEQRRLALADLLRRKGPATASDLMFAAGINGNSTYYLWHDPKRRFAKDESGRVILADSAAPAPAV